MAYKQNPGRGPMMKTGEGVPSALLQKDEKTGGDSSFPGKTWTRPDFTTKEGSYSRLQERAAIKSDSTRSSNYERRALKSKNLPKNRESFSGYGSRKYNVSIDPKSGDTTFDMGRSSDKYTVKRADLMKKTARKTLKEDLHAKFKGNSYLSE